MIKLKLTKQVFEIRYEHGYRYLDRCGEAMLVFEDVLPDVTGRVWMPEEIVPSGAKLKCPELDVVMVFDSTRLIVDHDPADVDFDFPDLCATAYSVISARFDLSTVVRMGCRRFFMAPADSAELAAKLSIQLAPPPPSLGLDATRYPLKSADVTTYTFESDNQEEGYRVAVSPQVNPGAPDVIDQRLLSPTRLLPSGQKEALLAQLQRRKQREKHPTAGVMIDIDYYWTRPPKADLKSFFERAMPGTQRLADQYANRR